MDLATNQTAARHRSLLGELSLSEFGSRSADNVALRSEELAQWRCGRIVTQQSKLLRVSRRWWPHIGNHLQVRLDAKFRGQGGDRCELFYHRPLGSPTFLTLSYIRSSRKTSLSTFYAATLLLDEIARLQNVNAIVCNVTNDRLSDRLLARWGWEPHCPQWSGRHFIKRFYGTYPTIKSPWRDRLTLDSEHTVR